MCGIVGYISVSDEALNIEKGNFLNDALILGTFRGADSTGVLTLCEDKTITSVKALLEGWDFVADEEYLAQPNGWAAIGHNRAATVGEVILENAHPFRCGPIGLVHNGTLTNMGRNLPGFNNKFKVDSIQIAFALATVEPNDAHKVLSLIDGAFALVWVDERDQSINIVRNGQRPLHFAHNSNKTIMWFTSDGTHLAMLKRRRWCLPADMGQIYQFGTNHHFKWKQGTIKPEVFKFSPFVWGTTPYNGHLAPLNGFGRSGNETKKAKKDRQRRELKTEKSTMVPSLRRMYLNGTIGIIPSGMIKDLKSTVDLIPEDILRFSPIAWVRYPNRLMPDTPAMGYVRGTVWINHWEADVECIVHNIRDSNSAHVNLRGWHVVPYGVTCQMPDSEFPWGIMAKVKAYHIDHSGCNKPKGDDDGTLPGPFGRRVSSSEWAAYTSCGCSNCSRDLWEKEAEDIWWVGEGETTPICKGCAEFLTDGSVYH